MVIYITKDGKWWYSWEERPTGVVPVRTVDLDRWYEYNLSELEILACLEALEE